MKLTFPHPRPGSPVPTIPAIADGLVLVHDAEEGGKEAELERWHEVFGERAAAELDANRCVAVSTRRGVGGGGAGRAAAPGEARRVPARDVRPGRRRARPRRRSRRCWIKYSPRWWR